MGFVPLPSDEEVVKAWRRHGENNTRTAEAFGTNESAIRKAVMRATGRMPRSYKRLPLTGAQLYGAFLKEGADRGAMTRLARRWDAKPQTVSAAIRRYLDKVDAV
ncbi:hypothetical protein SEA_WENTWORTH_89 [Streptomyces phage Wentworth]|nr:hypothetical protein SEA_WENTWORTH_89 [Streptomyces phage Wentworth]